MILIITISLFIIYLYTLNCYAKTTITGEEIDEDSRYEELEIFCCKYCDKEFDTLKRCNMS